MFVLMFLFQVGSVSPETQTTYAKHLAACRAEWQAAQKGDSVGKWLRGEKSPAVPKSFIDSLPETEKRDASLVCWAFLDGVVEQMSKSNPGYRID